MNDRYHFHITDRETELSAEHYLISRTDRRGIIQYANPAFVQISGYERDELIGQPHNIVRHPDMPAEAFGDLWRTIKRGETWQGLVKNRRKDGGYYWVLATVSPMRVDGEVRGYASVRVRPEREAVRQAEQCYAQLRDMRASALTLERGQLVSARWAALRRLSGWLAKRRSNPTLQSALQIIQQIAAGNLILPDLAEREARGQEAELLFYLDVMKKSLVSISHDVHHSLDATVAASRRLYDSSSALSERTQDQAASLQQIAASVEQLAASVKHNASHAATALQIAQESRRVAQAGNQVVSDVVERMHAIRQRSHQEAEIIALIDAIAFQTNILALNAAVEASRAGNAGRGFAVVASSIRELAQRTTNAAREIKALVDQSVAGVEEGVRLAESAGSTMGDLLGSVSQVTELMTEVSHASSEQAQGIDQLSKAIVSVDGLTQDNAAMVDDLGAMARELTWRGDELTDAIGVLSTR